MKRKMYAALPLLAVMLLVLCLSVPGAAAAGFEGEAVQGTENEAETEVKAETTAEAETEAKAPLNGLVTVNGQDGDIVLMHDLYSWTASASQTIIPTLVSRGYQLVTVSELAECRGGMTNGTVYKSFRK